MPWSSACGVWRRWRTAWSARWSIRGLPWLNAVLGGTLLGAVTPTIASVVGFSAARMALGLAEGGNFPGAIKTVGLWHPKSERALSTGIFNSGTNMGVILSAYAVPLVVQQRPGGWAAAFYLTGALGFLWLIFWLAMYDTPERHPAGLARRTGPYPQRSARPGGPHSLA